MSALFYYGISSDLTEDEIIEIDKQVARNRQEVYLFLTKLPLNGKRKSKRLFLYGIFLFHLGQPLSAAAVVTSVPTQSINRLYSIEGSRTITNTRCFQIASIPSSKVDKIRFTNEQIKQFDGLTRQLSNGFITMEEAILQLRGGSGLTDIAAVIAFYIFVDWYDLVFGVKAFQVTPLPHQDPFGWLSGKYNRKPMSHISY